MENIEEVVRRMEKQVNKLYTALLGSEITKDGGLVRRVEDGEKELEDVRNSFSDRMTKIERANSKMASYVKVLWLCAGAIMMALFEIFIKK